MILLRIFLLSIFCGLTPNGAIGNDRLECFVTSPMKDQVGEGGYSFDAYSNLAIKENMMCLQHVLRNHEGNTAVKVLWYEPAPSGKNTIISVNTLPGCYDNVPNQECDCRQTSCQVSREFYTASFGIRNILSTAAFGIQIGQYTDDSIRARNFGLVSFLDNDGSESNNLTPDPSGVPSSDANEDAPVEVGTRYAILEEESGEHSDMTTRLSGFPAGSDGVPVSLDIYFHSNARRSGNSFLIENYITYKSGFNDVFVVALSNTRSGEINLENGAAAIAWKGFEPEGFESVFDALQTQLASLEKASAHSYEVSRLGIRTDAEIVIYRGGEILLETQAPVYVGIE